MQSKIESLPRAAGWMLLFVAVLAHMPALRGYFAQDDWSLLARGAGEVPLQGWIARPLGSFFYWRALWPLFGAASAGYHGAALLWSALIALMCARVGLRLGLGAIGASVAGLVVAASPLLLIPIFWVAASQELLSVLFALVAVEAWLAAGRWRWLALLAALLSFSSKEAALGLAPWLYVATLARGRRIGRGDFLLLGSMALLAALFAATILQAIPHGPEDPYALGGAGTVLRNLAQFGSWLISPTPIGGASSLLLVLGGALWVLWFGAALLFWRRGTTTLPMLALLWALSSLIPVIGLRDHLYPYYLCAALVGWAWFLGWLAERALPIAWRQGRAGNAPAMAWTASCLFVTAFAWSASESYFKHRDADGLPVDPIVRRSWTAAEAKQTVDMLPLRVGSHLTVLQATRLAIPNLGDETVLVGSPLFLALRGPVGLSRIVPEGVEVEWASHLDTTPINALVLLDDGGFFLRPLGDAPNARIYSALIAVAAGQYDRARHDLWNVVGPLGSEVRWAYDSEALDVDVQGIKSNARGFAEHLVENDSPANGRILRIFEQLFEAVTGEKMIQPRWGGPVKG